MEGLKIGMSSRRKKAGITAGVIILGLLVCLFGYRVININHKYPKAKVEHIECGKKAALENGITVRVKRTKFLTTQEYIECYGKGTEIEPTENMYVVLTDVILENPTEQEQTVDVCQFYIEKEGYYNGLALDTFLERSKGREDTVIKLKNSEKHESTLAYILYDYQFKKKDWEKLPTTRFYLVNQRYPVKTCWDL